MTAPSFHPTASYTKVLPATSLNPICCTGALLEAMTGNTAPLAAASVGAVLGAAVGMRPTMGRMVVRREVGRGQEGRGQGEEVGEEEGVMWGRGPGAGQREGMTRPRGHVGGVVGVQGVGDAEDEKTCIHNNIYSFYGHLKV